VADVRAYSSVRAAFQSAPLGNIAVHSDIKSQGLAWVTMCRLWDLFYRFH